MCHSRGDWMLDAKCQRKGALNGWIFKCIRYGHAPFTQGFVFLVFISKFRLFSGIFLRNITVRQCGLHCGRGSWPAARGPPCVRVSTVESHEEEATLCVSRTCCFHQLVSYVFWTAIVTMAPPSKKKKALREANIKKALKRWRKDGQPESATITTHLTAAGPSSSAQALLSSPHGSHLSSAEYRHSLLPQEVRETHEVSDDGVVILISVARLKALTNLVRCD